MPSYKCSSRHRWPPSLALPTPLQASHYCTAGPHNNLASNLDMGLGQRAFGSGGDGHRGDHAGEGHWCGVGC